MQKRPAVAGLAIALLTLKPHMGVLIPLLLLLRGEWRTIAAAAAGTVTLFLLSVALFGWGVWADYFGSTAAVQTSLLAQQGGFFLSMMPTPYVSFWLASGSMAAAIAAHAAFAGAALWILVRSALRGAAWPELGLMAATATFLVVPYAFDYDMAVVGLAAAMLLYGDGAELSLWERLCALLALAAPIMVLATNGIGLPLLPFASLGFLVAQARHYGASDKAGHRKVGPLLSVR